MKFLTVLSHLDDRECFYGIFKSLCSFGEGYSYTPCKGRFLHDSQLRKETHNKISDRFNIHDVFGHYGDLSLPSRPLNEIADNVYDLLTNIKPDILVIHSESDVHQDHKTLSQACKIAVQRYLRANNIKVVEVLHSNIFTNIDHFFAFDLDDETLKEKKEILSEYFTENLEPDSADHKVEYFKVYEKLSRKIQKHNVFNSKSFRNFLKC